MYYTKCVQGAVGDTGKTMTGTQHYDLIIIGGGPSGQGAQLAAFDMQLT